MADASDTMRYLVKSFDIAPAGTREEGQAAKGLSEVFHEHGLETANKSFRYSSLGKVPQAACLALAGVAGILSGLAGGALPIVMFAIAAVMGVLYGLEAIGIKTVSRIGASGSSQNVVARHPAAASLNGQKARPVVVIAHYDTPRADILATPPLARLQPYLSYVVRGALALDVLAMFFQMLPVPTVLHSIAWAVSLVTSAILIAWALCVMLQRFAMPFTVGANDNKASIAALFGLLDRVRPLQGGRNVASEALYEAMEAHDAADEARSDEHRYDDEAEDAHVRVSERRRPRSHREDAEGGSDGRPAERPARRSSERRSEGRREEARSGERRADGPVRYGADVVRSLGILPESCVLEYEQPEPEPAPTAEERPAPEPEPEPRAQEGARVHRASEAQARTRLEANLPVGGATVVMSSLASGPSAAPAAEEAAGESVPAEVAVADEAPVDPEAVKDAATDAIMAGIVGSSTLSGSQAAADEVPAPQAGATVLMEPVSDQAAFQAVPQAQPAYGSQQPYAAQQAQAVQPFRLITSSDDYDAELSNSTGVIPPDVAAQSAAASSTFFNDDIDPEAAAVVSDPTWGTSSFRPVSVGRRILGDIPDPAVAAVDPFSVSSIEPVGSYNPEDFSELDFETGTHQAVTPTMLGQARLRALDGFSPEITDTPKRGRKGKNKRQGRISHQAARMQAEMEQESFNDWLGLDEDFDAKTSGQQIGSWDNFADDQGQAPAPGRTPRWQGGAARARRSTRSRDDEGNAAAEVRRAAMTLGDRELISHEIWFVLTGASEADHAGVEDFLKTYRSDLRGAYFINLECVGAGRQALVLEEGERRRVKADRRLVNLFGSASLNINRPLELTRMNWRDTEVTPLLRQGCRAVTVAGVEGDVPANARWTGDTPEKVNPAMIDDLVDILVEVIKNA